MYSCPASRGIQFQLGCGVLCEIKYIIINTAYAVDDEQDRSCECNALKNSVLDCS